MFKKVNLLKVLLTISISFLLLSGCSRIKKTDDPLIIPPNFNEMPDLNNKETIPSKQKDKDIDGLQDLLL